jgi:Flp pilus assembly protein TadD
MNKMAIAKLTTSALVVGTLVLATSLSGQAQGPTSVSSARAVHAAAVFASGANKALAKKQGEKAVALAEKAVAFQPRDAGYRMLLGQAYLAAGRFQSAEQSFSDTLMLNPERERAALNLALAQIAQGKNDAAKSTLADYREKLPAADFGLAMALAGDVNEAVRVLEFATRAPDATAKTRQNLALAYALAGKWTNARVMAVQDMTPDEAEARVAHWAEFVRPGTPSDQIASLLGVTPRADGGMPTQLALGTINPAVQTAAVVAPVAAPEPEPAPAPAPLAVAAVEPSQPAFEVPVAAAPAATPAVRFGPSVPVVQPLPAPATIRAEKRPVRQAVVAPSRTVGAPRPAVAIKAAAFRPVSNGKFVVQIGAFQNAASAERAWNRLSGRVDLASFNAVNGAAKFKNASLVRVAIGGLGTRADADQLCNRIKQSGGVCFVRVQAGDAPARWVQRQGVRVASR